MLRSAGFAALLAVTLIHAPGRATAGAAETQFPRLPGTDRIRIPKTVPLDRLPGRGSEPAITTGLTDALTEVPFLDDYNPQTVVPMRRLPGTAGGGFRLVLPGVYELNAQSYCLHAGTYAPTKGKGYLYAPLAGPRAGVIRSIARNSVRHPEVSQHDIQTLIWGILAHAKIRDMAPHVQSAAARLLTLQEIQEIDGSALSMLAEQAIDRASRELAPALRPIFEAEARLRSLVSRADARYEDLERVAVRFGEPPLGEGSREVPHLRWSYHPAGYFVRYDPGGYSQTRIQLAVPGPATVERDAQGRIAKVADARGARLELVYSDAQEQPRGSGQGEMQGSAFRQVRFDSLREIQPRFRVRERKEWRNAGWTFTGVPAGRSGVRGAWSRFVNSERAADRALASQDQLDSLIRAVSRRSGSQAAAPQQAYRDAIDLAHLAFAVEGLEGAGPLRQFLQEAWQAAAVEACGGRLWAPAARRATLGPLALLGQVGAMNAWAGPAALRFPLAPAAFAGMWQAAPRELPEFDPSEEVACPGNTGSQRLLQSGRDDGPPDDDCTAAGKDMWNNLVMLDAYSNQDIVNQAGASDPYDTDLYDAMVGRHLAGKPTGNMTRGEVDDWKNKGMDAATNSRTCEVGLASVDNAGNAHFSAKSYQDIIDALASQGSSAPAAACIVAHERTHQQQCFANNNFAHSSVSEFSNYERQAYCAQLRCLADYMAQKCNGAPSSLQDEMNQKCR
jgi:hypothetical protein